MLEFSCTYSSEEKNHSSILNNGSTQRANVVLAGERLLGIGLGIVDGKARIQRRTAFVKSRIAMPFIGSAARGNDH